MNANTPQTCLATGARSTADVLAQTPAGKRAMFELTSFPSSSGLGDHVLGEYFTFTGPNAELCISRERISLKGCGIRFVSYIDENQVS